MSNQSVGGIKICFDLSIPCKNIKVTWISQEGILTPCLDESGNKTNCIEIYPNPYATGDKCIEGWIFCDECLHGNNKPIYFKKCFCDTDADCTLECETCKQYGDVKVCEQSLTPQQIKEGRLCNGDCPPNKKYYNDVLKRCVECIEGTTHHLNKCLVCTNGEWKPKCPVCDPVTGECVDCISDDDCKNNTDGRTKCGPDGCQCLPGFHYDYVLKKCVPDDDCKLDTDCPECFVCDKITLPNGDIKKVCVPLECPKGYKCWEGKCHPWDCPDISCDNGGDCARTLDGLSKTRCGCTDRVFDDYIQRVCIPCELLKCDGECQNSLGCECDPVTNKCKSSDTCTQTYCDDFTPCDGPNCTCYEFQCVSCDNFPCDPDECSSKRNCGCVGGDCRGTGNPPGGGGGNCGDSLVINKDCDNCDLEAILTSDGCKCSDIKTKVKSASFSNGKIKFEVDNFKGNYNFENYKDDDHFGDNEILKGLIKYQIVIDGNPVYTGQTSIGNNNSNTIPDIEVDISSYIPKDASTKNIQIVFLQSGYTTESNDCTKYSEGTIGTFNYNLTKTNGVPIGIVKENIVKDDVSSKKPIFIWTKDGALFRKEYPTKTGNTYRDKLSTAADGLELLKTYVVKTDCPGCGNSSATHASLEFCCLDKFAPVVTNCGTEMSAPPIPLCDVNEKLTDPILEVNGLPKDWSKEVKHSGSPITSLRGYLKIKPGNFKAGQEICSTTYPIPTEKANVVLDVKCEGNIVKGTLTETSGLIITDVTSDSSVVNNFQGKGSSVIKFEVGDPTLYLNTINSTGITLTVTTKSGCKVLKPLVSGDCPVTLKVEKTDVNNNCFELSGFFGGSKGTIKATVLGGGNQLTGYQWTLNGVAVTGNKLVTNTGYTISLGSLDPGSYVVAVSGHGVTLTSDTIIIKKANTLIKYTLDKINKCGATLSKITLTLNTPATTILDITIGGVLKKILVGGTTAEWTGLADGSYSPVFNLPAGYLDCPTDPVTLKDETVTKQLTSSTALCFDTAKEFILNDSLGVEQNLSNYTITPHQATYDSVNKTLSVASGTTGSYITICPNDACTTLTAGANMSTITVDNKGCLKHMLTVNSLPSVTYTTVCGTGADAGKTIVTVSISNHGGLPHTVDIYPPTGIVKYGDGRANSNISVPGQYIAKGVYAPDSRIVVTKSATGCTKTTTMVGMPDCSTRSTCPELIEFSDVAVCAGNNVNFAVTSQQLVAAGYEAGTNVNMYITHNGNAVANALVAVNTGKSISWTSPVQTTHIIRVTFSIPGGDPACNRYTDFWVNVTPINILTSGMICTNIAGSCSECQEDYECVQDNEGQYRCTEIDGCPPEYNGTINAPCSIPCPCIEPLECNGNGVCVNPDVDVIDCGECGIPIYEGGVIVGCNCNADSTNCEPGSGCGDIPGATGTDPRCECSLIE